MQEYKKSHFRLPTNGDSSVHVFLIEPIDVNVKKLIIFSHGFSVSGTESRRIFIDIAERLASRGCTCILFDYRGNGYSDMHFENMTFDTQVVDLTAVINYYQNQFSTYSITIWGLSFGTSVAALTVNNLKNSKVDTMILWSLSAELYDRYAERHGPEIFEKGYVHISKGDKLSLEFVNSLKGINTYEAIKNCKLPVLVVHGDGDTVADVKLARKAKEIAGENVTLNVIEDGSHGFKFQPELFEKAVAVSFAWLGV